MANKVSGLNCSYDLSNKSLARAYEKALRNREHRRNVRIAEEGLKELEKLALEWVRKNKKN
ncbi:MAG: hypothetical protein HY094_07740 [Candidatus Melainabacteria bacterium]|nr:hypothetical protein [Candidatus Melainabacteria bacterium]